MSPVSRGRKGKKKTVNRSGSAPLSVISGGGEPCDCPACTGGLVDPDDLIESLLAGVQQVIECDDPLEAEIFAAAFVTIGSMASGFEEALLQGIIPQVEDQSSAEAVAMLLALGTVAPGPTGAAAWAAADRLAAGGVPRPWWAGEIREPITVGDCRRITDADGEASMLMCSVGRAGRSHSFVVYVDNEDCGAAEDIAMADAADVPEMMKVIESQGRDSGLGLVTEALDGPEFRWQVEAALDARAVHDGELSDDAFDDPEDSQYPVLATLLRARVAALPRSTKPPASHADGTLAVAPAPRRAPDDGATIYQLKIGLRGAKPPIWRRLEVPADVDLAELHSVIQAAFDWDDSHMHVFETPYGSFGIADRDLDHRAEESVTLAQVAPAAGSKLRYTYDFGDDWEHEIVVEKVLAADSATAYPRCTGGRRAAPPEDCGGVWGYDNLLQVLKDPTDPEHAERLEWMGLDDPTDFDPAEFDITEVNRALNH